MKQKVKNNFWLIVLVLFSCQASLVALSDENSYRHSSNNQQRSDSKNRKKNALDIENDTETIEIWATRRSLFRTRVDAEKSEKVEVLSGNSLRRYGAHSLADAMQNVSGVETQTFCANCGAKRLTINGLRGEHTTILIDGIPMHSTVSSFYGIDAIPVVGLEEVEVRRGSGSALVGPESIGGTINLITADPIDNKLQLMSDLGSHGSSQTTLLATAASAKTGILVAGQQGRVQPWDIDNNQIAEFPYRQTQSATVKLVNQLHDQLKMSYRFSEADLLIIGGNTKRWNPGTYTNIQAQPDDFINGDVRQPFIGPISRITDVIELKRRENAVVLDFDLSDDESLQVKASLVRQNLDAFYSHAYDYTNQDEIRFYDANYRRLWGNYNHLLTIGIDRREQAMTSSSEALYIIRRPPLLADDLKFDSQAFYIMNEWQVNDKLSLDLALRVDQLSVNWTELDRQLNETVVAPRGHVKYAHTDHISSRFSYGVGYRPPLTLFESEHGSDHSGFLIEIDQIEKAHSYVYSLSMNYPSWFVTFSSHYTQLKGMAYANDYVLQGQPIQFKNSEKEYPIFVSDLFFGGKPTEWLDLQVSYERFFYQADYAQKLPTAALEERIRFDSVATFSWGNLALQATYIGARNLSKFGYNNHYNRYNLDVTSDEFGQVSEQKNQHAPAFWLVNTSLGFHLSENYDLLLRADNLFNFTQTGTGDSPTTWHWHINHAHYDNFHTWGPLSGRELFIGLQGTW